MAVRLEAFAAVSVLGVGVSMVAASVVAMLSVLGVSAFFCVFGEKEIFLFLNIKKNRSWFLLFRFQYFLM